MTFFQGYYNLLLHRNNSSSWKWRLSELTRSRGENDFISTWIQMKWQSGYKRLFNITFPKFVPDAVVWLLSQDAFQKMPKEFEEQ